MIAFILCGGCLHLSVWKTLYSLTEPAVLYNLGIGPTYFTSEIVNRDERLL